MQKSRILLPLIIFPFLSTLTIFLIHQAPHHPNTPEVLAAKTSYITSTPILTSSPSATHIVSPSPVLTKSKTVEITYTPISPTDYILEEINTYRTQRGLSRVSANSETCGFAKIRAEEISQSFTHDGFSKRVSEKNLPYPSYSEISENIAYNTDYKDVVKRWIASPGHEENMRKNTPFICIGKYGDYYTFEGWRP